MLYLLSEGTNKMGEVRTVYDFKAFVLSESGVSPTFHFSILSTRHLEFWRKLNNLGARNIDEFPPEKVPNIDATVILSDEEWDELEAEFRSLPKTNSL